MVRIATSVDTGMAKYVVAGVTPTALDIVRRVCGVDALASL